MIFISGVIVNLMIGLIIFKIMSKFDETPEKEDYIFYFFIIGILSLSSWLGVIVYIGAIIIIGIYYFLLKIF